MIWLVEIRREDGTVDPNESGHVAAPDEEAAERLGWLLVERAQLGGAACFECTVTAVDETPIRKQATAR